MGVELVTGSDLHERVIQQGVMEANRFVWIATANLKDMRVEHGGRFRPILKIFDDLSHKGVTFRIVHSELPSRPFRETLERLPKLYSGALELQICPRSHWKMVIVDGKLAYWGSANFTGAGLGAKADKRRNFEMGTVTTVPSEVARIRDLFDEFWLGSFCPDCKLRDKCPDPI